MSVSALLPDPQRLRLEYIVSDADTIMLVVQTTCPDAVCPTCGQRSRRVHGRYRRTLADLPWHGLPLRLHLSCRKFFCGPGLTPERTAQEVEGIVSLLALPPGSRILDLCCGHGRHAIPLAHRGYQVTGQDLSEFFL